MEHNGQNKFAYLLLFAVASEHPIAASANEICINQALYLTGHLSDKYAFYFNVALDDAAGCGPNHTPGLFGNLLLVERSMGPIRDTSNQGYRPAGSPQNGWTHIFDNNYNNSEHKRVDCAGVQYSNASSGKFWVCTLHTTGTQSNAIHQIDELVDSTDMRARHLFMGDWNQEAYITDNMKNWHWDTNSPTEDTHSTGKIDWVLGRYDADFYRTFNRNSERRERGIGTGQSDHNLLVSYLRAS